jgi:putative endonuclease
MTLERITQSRRAAESRGRSSETLAALLLRLKFYRILGRRIRTHAGEIDLVARAP